MGRKISILNTNQPIAENFLEESVEVGRDNRSLKEKEVSREMELVLARIEDSIAVLTAALIKLKGEFNVGIVY